MYAIQIHISVFTVTHRHDQLGGCEHIIRRAFHFDRSVLHDHCPVRCGAGHIKIMRKEDVTNPDQFRRDLWWLDAYNASHLPSAPDSSRRIARERHGRNTNCLFVDGHSGKMNSMDMTTYDWGLPRTYDTP